MPSVTQTIHRCFATVEPVGRNLKELAFNVSGIYDVTEKIAQVLKNSGFTFDRDYGLRHYENGKFLIFNNVHTPDAHEIVNAVSTIHAIIESADGDSFDAKALIYALRNPKSSRVTAFTNGAEWLLPYANKVILPQLTDKFGLRLENKTLDIDIPIVDRNKEHKKVRTEIEYRFNIIKKEGSSRGDSDVNEVVTVNIPKDCAQNIGGTWHITRNTISKTADKNGKHSVIPNVDYRAYCSSIMHETVHILDNLIHLDTRRERSPYMYTKEGSKDKKVYRSSPSEISAYSTQAAWLVDEKATRIMQAGGKPAVRLLEAARTSPEEFYEYTILDRNTTFLTNKMFLFVNGTNNTGTKALRVQTEKIRRALLQRWGHTFNYNGT